MRNHAQLVDIKSLATRLQEMGFVPPPDAKPLPVIMPSASHSSTRSFGAVTVQPTLNNSLRRQNIPILRDEDVAKLVSSLNAAMVPPKPLKLNGRAPGSGQAPDPGPGPGMSAISSMVRKPKM